ncbi:MAG: serine hydrolase domain-containing protein [Pseudomonadota bacterium]
MLGALWLGLPPAESVIAQEGVWLEELKQDLQQAARKEKIAGAALVLVDRNGPVLTLTMGYADRKAKRPFTRSTRFPFANLTHLVTAVATMQLVEDDRVALTDPLTEVLPEARFSSRFESGAIPKLQQLLSHHSGLPSNVLAGYYQAEPPAALAPLPELYLASPPGQIYGYSNLAYGVLGHVVQQRSGLAYQDYVQQRILMPLEMNQTGFAPHPDDSRGHDKRRRVEPDVYASNLAALGLRGSIVDVGRLLTFFLNERESSVLSLAARKQMGTPQNLDVPLDLDNRSGLGWQLTNTEGFAVDNVWRVNANTLNFRENIILLPDQGLGLALVANSANGIDFIVDESRNILDRWLEESAGIAPPDREQKALPDRIPLPGNALPSTMALGYVSPVGLLEFDGKPERYKMTMMGRNFRATARDDGWYELAYRLLGVMDIQFSIMEEILVRPVQLAGREALLARYQGQSFLLGTALPPEVKTTSGAYLPPSGRYEIVNPDFFSDRLKLKTVQLEVENGRLFGEYKLPVFISLKPKVPFVPGPGPNQFFIPGLGTGLGERLVFDPKSQEFQFAGYRFAKVR